ncbi:MAG: Fic family protein [Methanosarcinales archaeon]|nr:MAG: Fic family protein [Methanosarcinales archaeon]
MAYLKRVKIKGREYWYFFHTVRVGNKFLKKSRYIGKELPSAVELDRIKKDFLRELTTTKSKYLSLEDVRRLESIKKNFNRNYSQFSKSEKEKYMRNFLVKFTYNTNAIEGSTLTLKDTSLILVDGITPKGKMIEEILEAQNMERCFDLMLNYKKNISLKFILRLHKTLMTGIDDEIAGTIRKVDVAIYGSEFKPPSYAVLYQELEEFFRWYEKARKTLHPLELASLVHLKFVTIHPFVDGNGRISRLLMNFMLKKHDFPMLNVRYRDREDYYDSLERCQIKEIEKPFIYYIKKEYFKAYGEFEKREK